MRSLREKDAWENTLILFLSDNGASAEIMIRGDGHQPDADPGSAASYLCLGPGWSRVANTPFRRHKTWVHEGGIATPLIAHWPAGIRDDDAWRSSVGHVVDIAPTLVALAGGTWEEEASSTGPPPAGRSLVATFAENKDVERPPLWWYHEGNRALRKGKWKLVAEKDGPWELYDLESDRSERENRAEAMPQRVASLAKTWQAMLRTFSQDAWGNRPTPRKAPSLGSAGGP